MPALGLCAGKVAVAIVGQNTLVKEIVMWFGTLLAALLARSSGTGSRKRHLAPRFRRHARSARPLLEALEDRLTPSTAIVQTNLVSDDTQFTPAQVQDPNLVNPYGLVASPTGAWWAANEGTGTGTVYNSLTSPVTAGTPIVNVPPNPADNPLPTHGSPTSIVYNASGTGFDVSENGKLGSSEFLFATTDGTISGWNPNVDLNNAIIGATNSGALYLSMAIATDAYGVTRLYAADFAKGTIDVYDQNFQLVTTLPGNFTDSKVPADYHPFNIQAINHLLYVEYAPTDQILTGKSGLGEGFVDVYNADGQLQQRLIQGGQLDQPWGVAMAPANFGSFSNDLLVGNFGNGEINAFNPKNGNFVGELKNTNGQPIAITHLWGLAFGNGDAAGPTNTLYFMAGLTSHIAPSNATFHGLFGSLQVATPQTNLVSDDIQFTSAQVQDPNLVNSCGLAASPTGEWWVANEGTGTSTVYNTSTSPVTAGTLVVTIPPNPADSPLPTHGSPTGIVYNTSGTGFDVSENGKTGSSEFLFATTDGTISGWNPNVDPNNAIIGATNSGALFLGLAIATDAHGVTRLYAADFAKGTIDVYDQNFQLVTTLPGNFTDSKLPTGYHPFDIQAIKNTLYVEYAPTAQVLAGTSGAGEGYVDVYNADGQLQQRLIQGGPLDQPWAVAMAPASFGGFSNDLLVGNFGNGQINAFNPKNGNFVGELTNTNGQPIAITHLWGLAFGNGSAAGPTNTLYFTAGLTSHLAPSNAPFHGLFGSLQVAPPTPPTTTTTMAPLVLADPAIVLGGPTSVKENYGDWYSQTLTATGGSGSGYTFALASGSSPTPGLSLSDGTISGRLDTGGIFTFTVVATDKRGATGRRTYTMTVDPVDG